MSLAPILALSAGIMLPRGNTHHACHRTWAGACVPPVMSAVWLIWAVHRHHPNT